MIGPNGPNTVEGRVEYCSNNVWGTISSSGFDTRDGEVVCKKIGYQHPRKHALHAVQATLDYQNPSSHSRSSGVRIIEIVQINKMA